MKARDVRELGQEGIERHVHQLTREYAVLAEAVRAGKEKNYARLTIVRRDIARARTVLHELKRRPAASS